MGVKLQVLILFEIELGKFKKKYEILSYLSIGKKVNHAFLNQLCLLSMAKKCT